MVIPDFAFGSVLLLFAIPLLGYPIWPEPTKKELQKMRTAELQRRREEKRAARDIAREHKRAEKGGRSSPFAFVVPCQECGAHAAVVTFSLTDRKITVATEVRYTLKGRAETHTASKTVNDLVYATALRLARAENFSELDIYLKNLDLSDHAMFADGLKNFCHQCNSGLCSRHHNTYPVYEEDGWYDYTRWVCSRGHEHGIDD